MKVNFRNEVEMREYDLKRLKDLFDDPSDKYGYAGKYDEGIDAYLFVQILYKGEEIEYSDDYHTCKKFHLYSFVRGRHDKDGYQCLFFEDGKQRFREDPINDLDKFAMLELDELIKRVKKLPGMKP